MKKKKQTYLLIFIPPWGLSSVKFRISHKKPNPREWTRGEGNCLVFRLVDGDYSTVFYQALQDETIMNDIGDFSIEADLDKLLKVTVPKAKIKMQKQIEKLRKQGRIL